MRWAVSVGAPPLKFVPGKKRSSAFGSSSRTEASDAVPTAVQLLPPSVEYCHVPCAAVAARHAGEEVRVRAVAEIGRVGVVVVCEVRKMTGKQVGDRIAGRARRVFVDGS